MFSKAVAKFKKKNTSNFPFVLASVTTRRFTVLNTGRGNWGLPGVYLEWPQKNLEALKEGREWHINSNKLYNSKSSLQNFRKILEYHTTHQQINPQWWCMPLSSWLRAFLQKGHHSFENKTSQWAQRPAESSARDVTTTLKLRAFGIRSNLAMDEKPTKWGWVTHYPPFGRLFRRCYSWGWRPLAGCAVLVQALVL